MKRLKAVGTVPMDMQSAYKEVVQRIESSQPGDKELAMKTLSWLFRAQRPLRMEELLEALALEEYEPDRSLDNVLENKLMPSDLLECCKSLVVFNNSSGLVRFTHFTVQQFIERHIDMLPPASHLARTCLAYVAFCRSEQSIGFSNSSNPSSHSIPLALTTNLQKFQLHGYAFRYCLRHIQGESENCFEVQRAFLLAFADRDTMINVWQTVYSARQDEFPQGILHFMARDGLCTICTLFLNGSLNDLYFIPFLQDNVNGKNSKSANTVTE